MDFNNFDNTILDQSFSGERPLYGISNTYLNNIYIGEGESGVKHGNNLYVTKSSFDGKYIFWHNDNLFIENCVYYPKSRSSLWYSSNINMDASLVECVKMFRECHDIFITLSRFTNADELFWYCHDINVDEIYLDNGSYNFLNCQNIYMNKSTTNTKYIFQKCKNVEIHNSKITSKDAFWESENITIYDSEISSEYLGWHSKNLSLINCKLSGEQILCYADNVYLENCEIDPICDRMFERSTMTIKNTSINEDQIFS